MADPSPQTKPANTGRTRASSDKDAEGTVADKAKDVAADASKEARSLAEDVKDRAVSQAEDTKDSVAEEGHNVASALRKAADEMRSGSPQERTLGQIADGIADASDAIKNKDMGQIVSDLNGFARRNPTVFLGAAALLGFAAIRFAKASTDSESPSNRTEFADTSTAKQSRTSDERTQSATVGSTTAQGGRT